MNAQIIWNYDTIIISGQTQRRTTFDNLKAMVASSGDEQSFKIWSDQFEKIWLHWKQITKFSLVKRDWCLYNDPWDTKQYIRTSEKS